MESGVYGMIGIVAGLLFGYLRDRDKLKYEKTLNDLQAQNAWQGTQLAANAVAIGELKKSHNECQEDHKATQKALDDCAKKHDSLEVRMEEIERKVGRTSAKSQQDTV